MAQDQGRLLGDDKSFAQLGIDRNVCKPWEDGMRLRKPFKSGEWEWWYCDAHLSDGYFCVASFNIDIDAAGNVAPFITLNIVKDNIVVCDLKGVKVDVGSFSASETECDVRLGNHVFRSLDGLKRYHVRVDPEATGGFGLDLVFDGTVPAYRPGTGRWDAGGRHFSWFCAVPGARVSGQLLIKGEKTIEVSGNGYHDHNWGDLPMDQLLSGWLWGRAEVDGTTVVSADVHFLPEWGGGEAPLLYVTPGRGYPGRRL